MPQLTLVEVSPQAKRLAVLGHPVSHSRSPAMQNAALEALGLAGAWSYEAIDVEPSEFAERTRELPGRGFAGVNVTIPHKEAALLLADEASEAAERIGAANTLSFREGAIRADNTDATGLLAALPGSVEGRRALVLGAGGSARAAVWALAEHGAPVSVWNRTPERADELVRDLVRTGGGTTAEGRLRAVTAEQVRANGYELIVNCTAIGMRDEDPFEHLPLDPERLGAGVMVVDLVYASSESRLVREARKRNAIVVEGLEVLVRQGADSLRIWTGLEPPLEVMRSAARGA
ncbi:MAG TPA: shikimate dehydrogenase [Solirubrobacterales bacterium]|nr:shikimate dehydrogenase [Solirubrobacterales bacterium]